MPSLKKFLKTYPGNVDIPMPLHVSADTIASIGEYGDIVTFGTVDGKCQQGSAYGIPHAIHPQQKYVLVP